MRKWTLLVCAICSFALCFGCNKPPQTTKKEDTQAKSQTKRGKFGGGKNEIGKTDPKKTDEGKKSDKSNTGKSYVNSDKQLPDVAPTTTSEAVESLDAAGLINCLGDADSAKRLQAAQRLVSLGEPSIAGLREALQAENYHVRAGAAFALGLFGSQAEEAAADLEQLSQNDEREAVRSAAAFALDAIQNPTKKAD